ncbi:MAG: right-handed parallel beta-helix repeat-containing protein [Planctomycetes bacterium]|nr:right-handed parallel beta-helix repeat-containing protein [Planctomycetota bacterium]
MRSSEAGFLRHFVITVIIAILFSCFASVGGADPNLVGWWRMDGQTDPGDARLVKDYSGFGNDGTMGSSDAWLPDGGIAFDGGSWGASGIVFPSNGADLIADMGLTDQVTISFVISGHTPGDKGYLFSGLNSTGAHVMSCEAPTGSGVHFLTKFGDGGNPWCWEAFNPADSRYIFAESDSRRISLVVDLAVGSVVYYLDDQIWATQNNATGSFSDLTSFTIGRQLWAEFDGELKDFRIYDKALNVNEIITLVNPVDLNGDKSVDLDDLAIIVEDWLESTDIVETDLNWDDVVNFEDYAIWADNLFEGGRYYFDSVGGDDGNLGTSPDQAWQSLSKFNSITFLPGEKIYFKADSVWTGQLIPKGSGVSGNPIIIDAYGTISDQNAKPRFNGAGTVGTTLSIRHVEYWQINNLQLTNYGATAGDWRTAASISAADFGTMEGIHLKNLYVHSVNSTQGTGGGISWFCGSNGGVMTKFNDILIEGCLIENLGSWAIQGGNTHIGRIETATEPENTKDFYPSTNVVVRGNRISNIDSSGIVIIGTDGCIVEENVIDRTMRTTQGGVAIWPWSADNTIIQYNEVYDVYDNGDGESYDSDYNCHGSVFQYNYSHDNPGGFMRICNGGDSTQGITGNFDTIVRYNISINDGSSDDAIFPTWRLGQGQNTQIYNNVVYSPAGSTVALVGTSASSGSGSGSTYYWSNNIFYSNGILRYDIADGSTNYWSNNCFYGTHQIPSGWFSWTNGTPSDAYKITSNPNFVSPTLSAPMGIDNLDGFKLQSGSPCINAGTTISNNGGYDFWGNVLYNGAPDIGAEEKQ